MLKSLNIFKYRKFVENVFNFSSNINIISGTNGTCKTSLLYLISNSFQKATNSKNERFDNNTCLPIITNINMEINPKIETLTKGDKAHNDPTNGHIGIVYKSNYFDDSSLLFRKHDSKFAERFSIKPKYVRSMHESLPKLPVIYLGLSRLFPYGEYKEDDRVQNTKKRLPENYRNMLSELYKSFTGAAIQLKQSQKMGEVKARTEFDSDMDGLDSNTISAGEDNLFIILKALVSLQFYYDSLKEPYQTVESILLVDEIDATLHPSYQFKLLELFEEYSKKYNIQIFFTTHSLSLLEKAFQNQYNVIYLIDNITDIIQMENPDIYKIKMHLSNITKEDLYLGKCIPVFTEDAEARFILNEIFNYFSEEEPYSIQFSKIVKRFHFVDANLSCEALKSIFGDDKILLETFRSFCILDGDQRDNLGYHIITLPGKQNPEEFLITHCKQLIKTDSPFFRNPMLHNEGYSKVIFSEIIEEYDKIINEVQELKEQNRSHGVKRQRLKDFFNNHRVAFKFLLIDWLHSDNSTEELELFFNNLKSMYKKVAIYHGFNPKDWN